MKKKVEEVQGYNGLVIKHIGSDYLQVGDIGVGDGAEKSRNDHLKRRTIGVKQICFAKAPSRRTTTVLTEKEYSKTNNVKKDVDYYSTPSWNRLRNRVLKRDHYKCKRCDSKKCKGWSFEKKSLTVHHIIPREDGGIDDMQNLVTLCEDCHDIVEVAIEERKLENLEKNTQLEQSTNWHSWVYGGSQRPIYPHILKKAK